MSDEEKKEEGGKKKGMLFIVIGIVLALFVLIAVVVFIFMGDSGHKDGANSREAIPQINLTPEAQALMQNEALRNPIAIYPFEQNFITTLKSSNPEDMSRAGYAKYSVSLILNDKNLVKELNLKSDIIRSVINDSTSGFTSSDLQSSQGRLRLSNNMMTNINSILNDGKVVAIVYGEFVIQP